MNTPTPNAMSAAKKLFPDGSVDTCTPAAILEYQTRKAIEIDAATGLPELVAVIDAIKAEHAAIEASTGSAAHVRHVRALREITRETLAALEKGQL